MQGQAGQLATALALSAQAELDQLRAEVQELTAERNRLLEQQKRIMDLIGAANPEHLVHDLRNVLNERALLRALTEGQF